MKTIEAWETTTARYVEIQTINELENNENWAKIIGSFSKMKDFEND